MSLEFLQVAPHIKYALLVLCVVVVIILLSKWTGNNEGGNFMSSSSVKKGIQKIMVEVQSPVPTPTPLADIIASTTKMAYLNSLRSFASDSEIEKLTNTKMEEMINELKNRQNYAITHLGS